MLKTTYIRDGHNRILGSTTSGLTNGDVVARDRRGHILGRSSKTFGNTRDSAGRLVSINTADARMLFRK
jgi:YD repeat-containing protein